MVRTTLRVSSLVAVALVAGLVAAVGIDRARAQIPQKSRAAEAPGSFTIFDTPQATLLLDRQSGNLWRIGYTEVAGQRYWFSTYVPREPPSDFAEFQQRVRKAIRGAPRD